MYLDVSLPLRRYMENLLKFAAYEYSKETKSWCAYIETFPGVCAQQDTVEETREELAGMLEEYVLINLEKGLPLPHFKEFADVKKYARVASYQPKRAYSEVKGA